MEVILSQLIFHQYSDEHLKKNCFPNCLKKEKFEWDKEWNENSEYSEDIQQSDIVFSIRDMNTKEDYTFVFINVQQVPAGNLKYTLNKIVLEETLSEDIISHFCDMIFSKLDGDCVTKYYIEGKGCYPYYHSTKKKAIEQITQEVVNCVKITRRGINAFPEFIEKLNNLKDKMNN